jgi:hypothetical protein
MLYLLRYVCKLTLCNFHNIFKNIFKRSLFIMNCFAVYFDYKKYIKGSYKKEMSF